MASNVDTSKLSDQGLVGLLKAIGDADSVELKLTVPISDRSRAAASLGVDPLEGQIRQVFFFDTPDLVLSSHGLVVRARRVQGLGDDSVVKLRPVVPAELPIGVRTSPNFGVEVDTMPGGTYVCSGSMKRAMGPTAVKDVMAGIQPVRKLFSKEQRALYTAHAPEGIGLDDLTMLGPIVVYKLRLAPKGYRRKLVSEMWMYPDNSLLLELSTKGAPTEAFQIAMETRTFLLSHGIDLSGEQETKTRKALQFFSRRLKGEVATERTSFTGDEARQAGSENRDRLGDCPVRRRAVQGGHERRTGARAPQSRHRCHRRRPGHDREDRARTPEPGPGLLYPSRTDGEGGGAVHAGQLIDRCPPLPRAAGR